MQNSLKLYYSPQSCAPRPRWGKAIGLVEGFANLDRHCERLQKRPAFLKAYAD